MSNLATARAAAVTFVETMIAELAPLDLNASAAATEVTAAAIAHFAAKPSTSSLPALAFALLGAPPEVVTGANEKSAREAIAAEIVRGAGVAAKCAAAFKPRGRWSRSTAAGQARGVTRDALRKAAGVEASIRRAAEVAAQVA